MGITYESGGLSRYSLSARKHAELYYEEIRRKKTDFLYIAKNTGFSIEQVQAVKYYVFFSKHYLGGNTMSQRFYPSYEMAESWRRLSENGGRHIEQHDVMLIKHELYEMHLLILNPRMSQHTAHELATQKYPYARMADEYYNKRGQ